jgi:hypothetical protein
MGWKPHTAGWYQVDLDARGILQAALILIIIVLSWPQRRWQELGRRIILAVPLLLVLLGIDAPLELLGNLQRLVLRHLEPDRITPLFAWDRFLEGGGDAAIALAMAAVAIALARERTCGSPSSIAPA